MAKVIFPSIGSQLKLSADWAFRLFAEHRNASLFRAMQLVRPEQSKSSYSIGNTKTYMIDEDHGYGKSWKNVILPAGTILQIDRIYIKKNNPDYDSLTFCIVDSPNESLLAWRKQKTIGSTGGVRFWAKLGDFRGVAEGEWLETPVPQAVNPMNKALHE